VTWASGTVRADSSDFRRSEMKRLRRERHELLPHSDRSVTQEVERVDLESEYLPLPRAGPADKVNDRAVAAGQRSAELRHDGQLRDENLALAGGRRADALGRVRGDDPVAHSGPEDRRHVTEHDGRSGRRELHSGHPRLHLGRPDAAEAPVLEERVDVQPERSLDLVLHARTVRGGFAPVFGGTECHAAGARVDVLAGEHRCGDLVEPALGVDLPREMPGMLFTGFVTVAGAPDAVRSLLDARHQPGLPRLPRGMMPR
jgi:hypothetical protein